MRWGVFRLARVIRGLACVQPCEGLLRCTNLLGPSSSTAGIYWLVACSAVADAQVCALQECPILAFQERDRLLYWRRGFLPVRVRHMCFYPCFVCDVVIFVFCLLVLWSSLFSRRPSALPLSVVCGSALERCGIVERGLGRNFPWDCVRWILACFLLSSCWFRSCRCRGTVWLTSSTGCLFSSCCLRPGRHHGCPVLPTNLCVVGLAWHMEQAGTAF